MNHDAVAALPITAPADQTLVRNVLVSRMPYVLADADTPTDLVAVDPSTGAAIVDIAYLGRVFHYDPADSTTPNDGVTCLVSSEGRRFKLAAATDVAVWAVLSLALTAPPSSPSLGDSYLVPAGATGAWSGHGDAVAVKTARGWEFITFGIGRLLYVEDIDTYYRRNAAGVWTAGLGASALDAASVTLLNVLGANASFVIKVENQTTNTPPVSPSPPTAYVIGSSPTGSWAGNAGKLAMCMTAGTWTIITPVEGDVVYDKALANSFRFDGAAWVSSAGIWIGRHSEFSAGGTVSSPGGNSNVYTYSASTAPTTSQRRSADIATGFSYTAKRSGATLRFQYSADCTFGAGTSGVSQNNNPVVLALFRDSEANAIAWKMVGGPVDLIFAGIAATNSSVSGVFEVAAIDTSSHAYEISIMSGGYNVNGSSLDNTNLTRRTFSVEESA